MHKLGWLQSGGGRGVEGGEALTFDCGKNKILLAPSFHLALLAIYVRWTIQTQKTISRQLRILSFDRRNC